MTTDERRLFTGLLGALAERFSDAGHVKAHVENEHRGSCPVTGCSLRCSTYQQLLIDASELLEAELAAIDAPTQGSLFDDEGVAG